MVLGSEIRDTGSGIRKKPIPDPGSRGQKGTGSRIRIRNTDYIYLVSSCGGNLSGSRYFSMEFTWTTSFLHVKLKLLQNPTLCV
jgi:hypothetical protein